LIYLTLKFVHVGSVVLSITLLVLRLGLRIRGSTLLNHPAVRVVPHVTDTVLLASAIALTVVIQQYPLVDDWLTVKFFLLVVYIVLAHTALKS